MVSPGFRIGVREADGQEVWISHFDFGSVIKLEGTRANISLPGSFKPIAYPDGLLGFDYARVNPACVGSAVAADDIRRNWDQLEADHFPLERVTEGLVLEDFAQALRGVPSTRPERVHSFYPSTPSFSSVVKLVSLIAEIRTFPQSMRQGFEQRTFELRRNLNGLLKTVEPEKPSWHVYQGAIYEALLAIQSKTSEFDVLLELLRHGYSCRLPKSKADLMVSDGGRQVTAEVKSRHHENVLGELVKRYQQETRADPTYFSPEVYLALLSWTTFGSVRRAIDEQKADILFCDLSYTFAGTMLPAVSQFWGLNLSFLTAYERARWWPPATPQWLSSCPW